MFCQNREVDLIKNKFFVNEKTSAMSFINDLKAAELNEKIYYSPSFFPYVDVDNIRKGSVFVNHIVPTEAFAYNGELIEIAKPSLTLDAYADILYGLVKQEIVKIYNSHDNVVLGYSGGIDSMVLLSFVMKLGLLNKTTLVTHSNRVSNYVMPAEKLAALNAVFGIVEALGAKVIKQDVTVEGLINTINSCDYPHVKAYATSSLLQQHKNTAFMFGFHGNQALMHKNVFVDQILIQSPQSKDRVIGALAGNYYAVGIKDYDVNKQLTHINNHRLLVKMWPELDGYNGNRVYAPLGVDLNLCRYVDYKHVDIATVLDAKVARDFINRNVGTQLDEFILTEGLTDGDAYAKIDLKRSDLTAETLRIPTNLSHNPNGVEWISNMLEKDYIEYNTLISIKMLQYLSNM